MISTDVSASIDKLMRSTVKPDEPGVVVAVARDGQVIHAQGYGMANLEWQQAMTTLTVLGIGSVSKTFTASAIMLLERQGKLQLDDPIQRYLPDYPTHGRHVTLRHLLTHSSGLSNFVTNPTFWERDALLADNNEKVLALFKDLPFDFEPGTRYSYCNSGYHLLGCIIEQLTGQRYGDAMRTLVFEPLGMQHTCYLEPESIIPQRASGYTQTPQGYQHARYITAAVYYAQGGLGTTAEDLLLWDAALRNGTLLDHETLQRMYAPTQMNDGHYENYGLGWVISDYRGHRVLGHGGGVPGFSSSFVRFPDDGVVVIVLANSDGYEISMLTRKISYVALDRPDLARTATEVDPTLLERVSGNYNSVHGLQVVHVDGQTLILDEWDMQHELAYNGDESFFFARDRDIEVRFENPDAQGRYTRIRVVRPFSWNTAERTSM